MSELATRKTISKENNRKN